MQAQRHAPGLKVTVYDGLAKKVADKDADDSAGAKEEEAQKLQEDVQRRALQDFRGEKVITQLSSLPRFCTAGFNIERVMHAMVIMARNTGILSVSRCYACSHSVLVSEAKK